jgi:hypothetical protein
MIRRLGLALWITLILVTYAVAIFIFTTALGLWGPLPHSNNSLTLSEPSGYGSTP